MITCGHQFIAMGNKKAEHLTLFNIKLCEQLISQKMHDDTANFGENKS